MTVKVKVADVFVLETSLPAPVMVTVYVPAVVFDVVFVVEELPPLPQPDTAPSATITNNTLIIDNHLRRRAGMPKRKSTASTAPPPAPVQTPGLPPNFGHSNALVVEVVEIVTVDVAAAVPPLKTIVEGLTEQVGMLL